MADDKVRGEQAGREFKKFMEGFAGILNDCQRDLFAKTVEGIILRAIRLARADEAELIGNAGILSAEPRKQMCDRRAAEFRRLAEGK